MGWVHEQMPSAAHTKVWQRKVLVLRKLQLQIFPSTLVTYTFPYSQVPTSVWKSWAWE